MTETTLLRNSTRRMRHFAICTGLTVLATLQTKHTFGQVVWVREGINIASVNAANPSTLLTSGSISGINGSQTVEGMDFRPATGEMYILGYESASGTGQLYKVNLSTLVATTVGSPFTLAAGQSNFGFDFNPTVDRIRITTEQRKNYRVHPNTGALLATDTDLSYGIGDPNQATPPQVGSVAYTNSYIGATSTLMYTYDDNLNNLGVSAAPNGGTISSIGTNAVAEIGTGELDIFYDSGSGLNTAYFKQDVNTMGGVSQLFTMDLVTGTPTLIGTFGTPFLVSEIAVQIDFSPSATVAGTLLYGLTSNNYLISFDSQMPSTVRSHIAVSGITAGQTLVGLDSRPATGQVYGLGYNSTSGDAQLYTINLTTGAATSVASAVSLTAAMTNVSFDFNPTVDRIRVTSAQDNNYRLHPVTGAIVATDGTLAYNVTDPNVISNPNIGAGSYTNSFIGSTSTGLYGYDVALNILTLQNPPNNGTLNTLGNSGITVNASDPSIDFDFYFNTVSGMNENYMIANTTTNFDNLYTVNLANGVTNLVGKIGNGSALTDVVAPIAFNPPSTVSGEIIYGLTNTASPFLITFDSEMPSTVRTHVPISGITAGQTIEGLDVRPATGELYALGYNATTGDAQLYTINPSTGGATSVAPAVALALNLGKIGFDFNPTVDRIRLVSASGNNYRLHPTTGAIAATDMNLSFASGDANNGTTPTIGSAAYTNSYGGSNNTKLFVYDDVLNVLVLQNPPNNGTLNTIGNSGITQSTTDATSDLDVFYNHDLHTNTVFMVSNSMMNDVLFTVNTSTGMANTVGSVGNGIALKDIAVKNDSITLISSTSSTITPTSCDSYTAPDNANYSASGTYTAIIPNAIGYDSLITVQLTVNFSSSSTIAPIVCGSYTAPDNSVYTESGMYMATIPNSAGCDSIIMIDLTVNTVDNSISVVNDTTLLAAESNGTYQWIDCANGTSIAGATSQAFSPTLNGNYSVVVTSASGCTDTSACATISELSLNNLSETTFSVYPNPSNGLFTITFVEEALRNILVTDATGRKVLETLVSGTQMLLDLSSVNNGIYFVQIGNTVKQCVKQ